MTETAAMKNHRLSELRDSVVSGGAGVTPAGGGLPAAAPRRTPGLRREEVAVLAGVGASWYQWLEQGRDISVSPQVLDSVARVLRMSSAERRHLYVLSGLNPPALQVEGCDDTMCDGLKRLIDAWMPYPAHIMDQYWNCVTYNDAAAMILGMRPETRQNCLIDFFTDALYRSRATHWEANAEILVAQFRSACSESPDDEGFRALVEEAKEASAEFAALWERRDISPGGVMNKQLDHPMVGALHFEATQLRVPARPDLVIVLHTPLQVADTVRKVEWLATPEGRRGSMYPIAG